MTEDERNLLSMKVSEFDKMTTRIEKFKTLKGSLDGTRNIQWNSCLEDVLPLITQSDRADIARAILPLAIGFLEREIYIRDGLRIPSGPK